MLSPGTAPEAPAGRQVRAWDHGANGDARPLTTEQ